MRPFVLAIGLSILSFSGLQAQEGGLPGYIVKSSGDTIRGILKEQGSDESAKQIAFKPLATDVGYQVYTPGQVRAYRYDSGNLFRAIMYADTRASGAVKLDTSGTGAVSRICFGKLLVTGEYDLYCFTEQSGLYFLVRKESQYYLIFDDELQTMPYVKGNFRSALNFLASGCDAMGREVESAGYTISGLIEFVQRLDACLNPNKAIQSYYYRVKGRSGFLGYIGGLGYAQRSQFTLEVRWRRVWPQLDPQFSLNIGFRFASTVKLIRDESVDPNVYRQVNYQMTSFPVTIQYNLLKGNFHPFVCVGVSLLSTSISSDPHVGGVDYTGEKLAGEGSIGLGFEAKITGCLYARLDWRLEYVTQVPSIGVACIF